MSGVDVVRVLEQTDVALQMAGLSNPNNILRAELRSSSKAIAKLLAADTSLDKCEAALDAHRDLMPESRSGDHWDAWASTHNLLCQERDRARKRRSAALAACKPKEGG